MAVRGIHSLSAEILAFFITRHPDGQIRIDIIQPYPERIGVRHMAIEAGRHNGAARGVMTTVVTILIGNATGNLPIPGQICPVLSE